MKCEVYNDTQGKSPSKFLSFIMNFNAKGRKFLEALSAGI